MPAAANSPGALLQDPGATAFTQPSLTLSQHSTHANSDLWILSHKAQLFKSLFSVQALNCNRQLSMRFCRAAVVLSKTGPTAKQRAGLKTARTLGRHDVNSVGQDLFAVIKLDKLTLFPEQKSCDNAGFQICTELRILRPWKLTHPVSAAAFTLPHC